MLKLIKFHQVECNTWTFHWSWWCLSWVVSCTIIILMKFWCIPIIDEIDFLFFYGTQEPTIMAYNNRWILPVPRNQGTYQLVCCSRTWIYIIFLLLMMILATWLDRLNELRFEFITCYYLFDLNSELWW